MGWWSAVGFLLFQCSTEANKLQKQKDTFPLSAHKLKSMYMITRVRLWYLKITLLSRKQFCSLPETACSLGIVNLNSSSVELLRIKYDIFQILLCLYCRKDHCEWHLWIWDSFSVSRGQWLVDCTSVLPESIFSEGNSVWEVCVDWKCEDICEVLFVLRKLLLLAN